MNERIKELAKQAGYKHPKAVGMCEDFEYFDLERFAELIRADETKACAKHYLEIMRDAVEAARLEEREACAKLCEDLLANPHRGGGWSDACIECSVTIRARKQ